MVLYFEPGFEVPFILGRPSLSTGREMIDVAAGLLTMEEHDKVEIIGVYCSKKMSLCL